MISFTCLWCSKQFTAPDAMAGKTVKCKSCGSPVEVPRPRPPAAAPARAVPVPAPPLAAPSPEADPFASLEEPESSYQRGGRGSSIVGKLLGVLGALLLGAGVFLPAFSVGDLGKKTFWQLGTGIITREHLKNAGIDQANLGEEWLSVTGAAVLFCAVLALLSALGGSAGMLWFTSLGSLGAIGYSFGKYQYLLYQFKKDPLNVAGIDFSLGLPAARLTEVRLQQGWAVLAAGAVLLFIAGLLAAHGSRRYRRY